MKIICIARNYGAHAAEMGAPQYRQGTPEALSPSFFLKPDSALLTEGRPFRYPAFSRQVEHEVELVVRLDRAGSCIAEEEAASYYSTVTMGIDLTARDLQREAKAKGLPWTLSKGFDGSAPIGRFMALSQLPQGIDNLHFQLLRNGETVQQGCTAEMLCSVDRMIAYLSQYITLAPGDLIFTGTPSGVGPVLPGDTLTAILEDQKLLEFPIL